MSTPDPPPAAPCDHRPDFYPSIMQWRCTRCGVPLRVSWPALPPNKAKTKEEKR